MIWRRCARSWCASSCPPRRRCPRRAPSCACAVPRQRCRRRCLACCRSRIRACRPAGCSPSSAARRPRLRSGSGSARSCLPPPQRRGSPRWSLRFPIVVCVLAGMLALYGVLVLARAKYDVFPEFVPPQAAVQTEAPGLVAEQVELLVTLPIEQAISGASGVQAVRSETISGLSVVTVVFQENLDPYRARQIVAEALGQVTARLPLGVKPPKLEPLTSSTMDL